MGEPLVVIALRQEALYVEGVDLVITGIGKVAAAVAVSRAVAERQPSLVLNVGTAGALHDHLNGAHVVGRVIEHDVDHAALGALIGEPISGEVVLDPNEDITLATGDAFVSSEVHRQALAARAHLVDMEGYAIARACQQADVPLRMVKVVSDTASADAASSWQGRMDDLARQIAAAVTAHL
ncbi:MAG: hypothetical protein JJE52_01695 [Acidimicrobiia bacterium]|nr:hypothetical protein [Acidimicrobiia bacterium]